MPSPPAPHLTPLNPHEVGSVTPLQQVRANLLMGFVLLLDSVR